MTLAYSKSYDFSRGGIKYALVFGLVIALACLICSLVLGLRRSGKAIVRNRGFVISTAVTAALGLILAAVCAGLGNNFIFYLLQLPFAAIGLALRKLSLQGGAGNAFAIILYALFSLIPIIIAIIAYVRDRKITAVKLLMFPLSAILFLTFYYSVNPNLFYDEIDVLIADAGNQIAISYKLGLSYIFYGTLLLILIIKAISSLGTDGRKYYSVSKILFSAIACGCTLTLTFFVGLSFLEAITNIEATIADKCLFVAEFIMLAAVCIAAVVAAYLAYDGAHAFYANLYRTQNAERLSVISKVCVVIFILGVVENILKNLLNFVLAKFLTTVSFNLDVSLLIAVLALGCALACKLLERTIYLKEDSDLTI